MRTQQEPPRRALVLSGGGGRGAYHIGVLEYLERVGWKPDLIIGSSVGAVNAAALGSGVSVSDLRSRWLDLTTADVQLMRADDVLLDNLLRARDHIFDLSPLPETLSGRAPKWAKRPWFDAEVLNGPESPYEVWVTAVNTRTCRVEYFSNRAPGGLQLEQVISSFSIPLWYGPSMVGDTPYWDGGMLANSPFRKALELGAAEIVVAMMTPWPERPLYNTERPGYIKHIGHQLLGVAQELWNAFEPALDAMLTENVWRDYLLYCLERQAGQYPNLQWLHIVAPNRYLTVGLMTHYQQEFHQHLFELGWWDAKNDLAEALPLLDSGSRNRDAEPMP